MKMKRAVIRRAMMIAVLAVAVAALIVPLVGSRTQAAGSGAPVLAPTPAPAAQPTAAAPAAAKQGDRLSNGQTALPAEGAQALGAINSETRQALGLNKVADPKAAADHLAQRLLSAGKQKGGDVQIQAGEPELLAGNAAFSSAIFTAISGRDTQFDEVALLADWDGREDCVADRAHKVDDFSGVAPDIDFVLTRTAISEHTIANGFTSNVFYYGDSVGNVWVGVDTNGDARVDQLFQINLPTALNAFGSLASDDQVTVTGLGVNPVADLTSFANVNGSYAPFAGVTGEILYVSYTDSESGLRLNANGTLVRSGVLAFPVADFVSPAAAPPGVITNAGFPVTVGGAFGVVFSQYSNIAGVAVDDDGSVYFQQVDLVQFSGANIVKISSMDSATNQDRSLATSGFPTFTTLNPTNGLYPSGSGPATQVNRFTNYSGTSTLWGDIVALASAPSGNALYAAVSRSFVAGDVTFEQLTEGLFPAPAAFTSGTPSMVISFADCSGAFDICSGNATGGVTTNVGGTIPAADGIADAAVAGQAVTPGVNNYRVFVLGNGPDIRAAAGGTSIVPNTLASVLKIDMQIDYQAHAGITVTEEGTVYVVSGGAPGGPGKNPSPMVGEILCFEDMCPMDRRADFVDLRGDVLDNPPISGG